MFRNTGFKYLPLGICIFCLLAISGSSIDGQDKVDVLIGFHAKPGEEDLNAVKAVGGKINRRYKIIPSVAASLPAKAVAKLLANPRVKIVEPDGQVSAGEIDSSWGVKRIACPPVHDGSFLPEAGPVLGTGVKVAVLDTGIDYMHSQLMDYYKGGYDFVNNDSDPMDDHRHGTHCAGIIAAKRDGLGVVGAAPEVDLYAVKVLGSNNYGSWSGIIAGVDWCVANNIQVASVSLGSTSNPGWQVQTAFDNARDAGVVVVACAGNSGSGTDTVWWPAKYDSVISVAATTNSDTRSSFSSTGPSVELAAPGSSVRSTLPNEAYGNMSGTSMACPHVSGLAALLISAGIPDTNNNGRINDEVRAVLQATAVDMGTEGRDEQFGYGIIDAPAAVTAVYGMDGGDDGGSDPPPPTFDPPTNLFGTVTGNIASLSWEDNSTEESGFEVWEGIKVKKTTTWTKVLTTDRDTTTLDLNCPDGKYLFRVRAVSADGQVTAYSNEIQVTVGSQSGGGKGGGGKKR